MASINTIVKRKQYLWLGIVVVGTASAIGGTLYLSDVDMSGNGETVAEQEPVPDMTGVVDTTFDDKVRQHATTEMQVTAAQMQKQYEEIRRELDVLNKQRGDDQRRIEKLGQDNAALAEQVKALGANPVTATGEPVPQMPAPPPGPEGEPQPGNTPVSFPPQGSVAVPPPTAFYPGNGVTPPPQVTYQSVPVPIGRTEKYSSRLFDPSVRLAADIASAWNSLSQFGSNRGSSDSVTGGADSTMSAQDSMMASRMRSAVESYAKAHNISNEQATQELASRSTRASAGMYGDAHAEWGVKPKILGVGGGLGVRGGGRAGIDWEDNDAHTASSNTQSSHNARHDIDARATQDFKEASDYFTSRKVSESGSHTDNNADSRVDQLSAALNSAKQSYDQYTTNMTRSHEYAEMASRTESMSGQMSEDLSQQFAQYVMKHAPQDAEAILTNTSSPEIAERRRAMAWSFVQEQVQLGVDNAWRESRGDIGKGMESVPSGGGSQDIIADHQGHQAIIDQRTQDSNIRNDVKHQVDNMVTEYKGNIGDTQNSVRGEENIVRGQYSELQNHHKTEALSQNNKYNEEKSAQERMPGADSPQELMKRAKEYQDKYKQ
ncbi:hypothetical protein VEV10F_48110 (plasmid) [Escherichia coli]|nr:hypothetical protein VEV10F_48110 [Escherichia coli]